MALKLGGMLLEPASLEGYSDTLKLLAVGQQDAVLRLSVADAGRAYLLGRLHFDLGRPILVVADSAQRAAQLADQIPVWTDVPALLYAETDTFFYERTAPDADSLRQRLAVLTALAHPTADPAAEAPIVVASIRALMDRIMAPARFAARSRRIGIGQTIDVNLLFRDLVDGGYQPQMVVDEIGTFARRGGILDVFSPTSPNPIRIELFGDEIDTIREFDPATQRSGRPLREAFIAPARENLCDSAVMLEGLSRLDLFSLRPEVAEQWRADVEAIRQDESAERLAFYADAYCEATLFDYLSNDVLIVLDEPTSIKTTFGDMEEQAERLRGELEQLGELPPAFPRPYLSWQEWERDIKSRQRLEIGWQGWDAAGDGPVELGFRPVPTYGGRIKMLVSDIAAARRSGERVVLVSQQAKRLQELLTERDLTVAMLDSLEQAPSKGTVAIVQGELPEGFALASPVPGQSFTLLTDAELFGWSKPRRRVVPRKAAERGLFISDLEVGDYVVHVEHGIGRFQGLTHVDQEGVDREYVLVEYGEGDRLFVPVDQLDRLSRYVGVGEHAPHLHRLGTGDWARLKARVKAAVRDIARDLLDVYAAREVKAGFAFSPDQPWQRELEDSFPYVETPDQVRAIAETKADMERPKPMDRLICGDVGYGKTEVALRAAFKAVMDGKQVAILVPTTVLAQQHFDSFRARVQSFPVRVEMLSRFRSEREQQAIVEGLKSGVVDICVGTHRLIQKDIQFKDLGLVIIDEEQRFGVVHKERLKQLRKEVDVLTLTATPIPRTLYMALAAVRDMSTMETPPEDRLPIKTYVTEYDSRLIREATLREMDRGGQVYYVHNRVQSINMAAQRLAEIVPEALIEIGHGQMPEDRLEKVMVDFAAGRFDVLTCTTIIESGLDIPNVNTIIVNNADRFGLSQLYQLRGRVGRGAHRAYAYFLFAKDRRLSPIAEKRLRTIFEATELGSGFRIAMRDLEIRGAGNLLGTEQHGHVAAVGFDLYCRMLAEAVKELQGKAEPPKADVTVSLPITAYLPEDYVADESLRINLYQRMAAARTEEEVGGLVLEMRDRFGALPEPALNLAFVLQLKVAAEKAGVKRIETIDSEVVITVDNGVLAHRDELQREFGPALKIGNTQMRLQYRSANGKWLELLDRVIARLKPPADVHQAKP